MKSLQPSGHFFKQPSDRVLKILLGLLALCLILAANVNAVVVHVVGAGFVSAVAVEGRIDK